MSLNDLASIAIIIQGMLFIISIGLVWYQLRENTKLVRAANTQKLVAQKVVNDIYSSTVVLTRKERRQLCNLNLKALYGVLAK